MNEDVVLALRSCLAGDPAAASSAVSAIVEREGTARLLDAARRHRVLDAVAAVLRDVPGVEPATADELRRRRVRSGAHQLRVLEDLRWFADRMAEASVPWLAFKGPVIAALLYDPPELRSYKDLDLSIRRADFAGAIGSLEEAGARLLDANWTLIRREGRGQLHLALPLGTVADVHWHLVNRRSVRDAFLIDMDALLARARPVSLNGLEVRTLDAVDTVLHLCLHAALSGADRLGWLEDVRRSIVVEAPPWEDVVRRGRAWRAGAPVAVVLRRAATLLGAPVPPEVLRALDRSPARRWVGEWVDLRPPAEVLDGRRRLVALWPKLVRDGTGATLAAAGIRAMRLLISSFHRLTGEPGPDAETDAGAVFKPSGTARERRRFMRSVSARDR